MLAYCCLFGAGPAAANPFADVQPGHWSYQATKELVESGLVDDYNNSMFAKNKRISRYALAQLVGQALYRIDEATPKQKGAIKRLVDEYRPDLERLGAFENPKTPEKNAPDAGNNDVEKRLDTLEKNTSGIKDWEISGWFNSENTYGQRYPGNSDHEYKLEARLQFDKKVSDTISITYQMATKTYLDGYSATGNDNFGQEYPNSNKEKVFTRLAYLTWKPGGQHEIIAGKFAVWLAGGFLGDDYLKGVQWNYATDNDIRFSLLASRYESNADWPGLVIYPDPSSPTGYSAYRSITDRDVWYAKIATTFGKTDVGLHYLAANNNLVSKDDTNIIAATVDGKYKDIELSAAYGQNVAASSHNNMFKLQAAKTFGKHSAIIQYWLQEQNIDLPLENGNHTAFWSDQYSPAGLRGYRLIYGYRFTDNLLFEAFYGDYRSLTTHQTGQKYGFSTTLQF